MKGTGAKRNVCPGSCVSTGAKFPVAPVESAPMPPRTIWQGRRRQLHKWPLVKSDPADGHGLHGEQKCADTIRTRLVP